MRKNIHRGGKLSPVRSAFKIQQFPFHWPVSLYRSEFQDYYAGNKSGFIWLILAAFALSFAPTFAPIAPMTISATLKGPVDSYGRRRVYIRINEGRKRRFHATNIKIEPKYWKKKVIGHPDSKRLNEVIKSEILVFDRTWDDSPKLPLRTYWLNCMNEWERSKKPATLTVFKNELSKILEFSSPLLSGVNLDWLNKYKSHCYTSGNSLNTIWKTFKTLKTIIHKAYREKLIRSNPFGLFDGPSYKDPPKTFLTKNQVEQIDKFCQDKNCPQEISIAGTWFVLGCYTGLRYGDQAAFNKSKIKDGRLIIYTSKTGTPVSIKLNDKLKELLERVNYKPVPYTNTHYNRLLKSISAHLELPPLSAHMSRHTFATMCASAGISPEVTAKMMGITNLKTVMIYYQITGVRLDEEMSKLF